MGKGSGICEGREALLIADVARPSNLPVPFTLQDLQRQVGSYLATLPNGEGISWSPVDHDADNKEYTIDRHHPPTVSNGSNDFYYNGEVDTSQTSAYGIGLLYGVNFKSSQALVKAVSGLVGQSVHYTFRGSTYGAQQELGDGFSIGVGFQRMQSEWNAHLMVWQEETATKKRSSRVYAHGRYPTRQAALDHINEEIADNAFSREWGL